MTCLGAIVGLFLLALPVSGEPTTPGTGGSAVRGPSVSVFADGFESGSTMAWSLVVGEGLPEGALCALDQDCASGLLCCYPCGVAGCDNACTVPVQGGCLFFP